MESWQLYSILSVQLITGIISLVLSFLIYSRNKEYQGNKSLSIAFILYSIYPFGRFFYELALSKLAVEISIRISLLATILANGTFLIAISIFCLGSYAKDLTIYKRVGTIVTTLVCILISLPMSIEFVRLNPLETYWNPVLIVVYSAYMILTTSRMIYLLTNTMKELKIKNPEITEKLRKFRLAFVFSFGILGFSIIENLTGIQYFNIVTYFFLLMFIIYFSQPLMEKNNNLKQV